HDAIVVAILIFLAGGIYGLAVYWVLGAVLYYACRWFGSHGTYRRARHVLGFALAPVAVALVVFWPFRIAIEGRDLFRYGGGDRHPGSRAGRGRRALDRRSRRLRRARSSESRAPR